MNKYAILGNSNIVENIVEVDENKNKDSILSVKQILEKMLPDKIIVKETKSTGIAHKDSYFINEKFCDAKPYKSWIFVNNTWQAPKKYPNNNKINFWNEEKLCWEVYENERN